MMELTPLFGMDAFSIFIGAFSLFFFILTALYSIPFMKEFSGRVRYYAYLVLTLIASLGVVFSRHLLIFLICWGFLGLLLYLLIGFGRTERTAASAKKALIIIGGSDALMILGMALIFYLTGSFNMNEIRISLDSKMAMVAYACLAAGALAKAGCMPFHSWVPDTATDAPIPVTAYLPASLDKLLGIYFFTRVSLQLFQMTPALHLTWMIVGSLTIVFAVMMALVQHDLKRLLGYHAVSQVGYMVLGIGTGNPIALAGSLFHMLNNAIYKSCLFLCGGAVEKTAGTTDLEKLGGLGRVMPITFGSFLVASLAISGVPPLNGFTSKWLIYQGLVETAKEGQFIAIFGLIAAMFGSALTLASFMKVLHAVFLGQPSPGNELWSNTKQEPGFLMWGPMALLAFLCVLFGIFARSIPLKHFIFPSLGAEVELTGVWNAGWATLLIISAIVLGLLVYFLGVGFKTRETEIFMGGEIEKENPEMRVSGVDFYHTIQQLKMIKPIYRWAHQQFFDPYVIGAKLTSYVTNGLRSLHNGVLSSYLAWCLLGATVLIFILMR